MTFQSNYFVDKSTGTFADIEEALGLANLLYTVANTGGSLRRVPVTIHDAESCYHIELGRSLTSELVANAKYQELHKYLKMTKDDATPSIADLEVFDLTEQREKSALRKSLRETESKPVRGKRTPQQQEFSNEQRRQLEEWQPHPYYPIWNAIQILQADETYNKGVLRWRIMRPHYPELLAVILLRYSATPNLISESLQAWKELTKRLNISGAAASPEIPAVQLYNPSMGKGINKNKPTGVTRSGLDSFWPSEYLKHEGLYQAGITIFIGDDRKTYVVNPLSIELSRHSNIFERFRNSFAWVDHVLKADIVAALAYTIAFLEYHAEAKQGVQQLSQAVAGFQTVLYKNMGKASAVMNLSFIGLPVWVRPNSDGEVKPYIAVLQEHRQVIEQLGRTSKGEFMGRSDQLDLLREYRDFISGNDLQAFFQFAVGYSQYLTQAIENGWRCKMFSISNLERMISMSEPELQEIIDDPGFLRVAAAMRNSTVTLQRRKAQGQSPDYDIRYGLGLELNRAMNKRDTFVQALSEFVFKYNAETAQVQESSKNQKRRKTVSVDDLNAIVRLIDKFDFKTVGSLLIAYGYASAGEARPVGASEDASQPTDVDSNEEEV